MSSLSEVEEVFPIRSWQILWYIMILIVGGVGNCIVIDVILRSKKIKRSAPFNVYILALAIVDLVIALVGLPIYVMSTSFYDHPFGLSGEIVCKIWSGYFVQFWMAVVDIFLLAAICLERRKAIINPFSTLNQRRALKTVLIVVALFLLGGLVQSPTLVGLHYGKNNATVGNHCHYSYTEKESIILYFFVLIMEYIVTLFIMVICYLQVKQHITNLQTKMDRTLTHMTVSHNKPIFQKYNRTIETMKLVILAYFICITPNEVLYMVFQFGHIEGISWNTEYFQISVLLRFTNACINPILYSFHSKLFRGHFKELYPSVTKSFYSWVHSPRRQHVGSGYARISSTSYSQIL